MAVGQFISFEFRRLFRPKRLHGTRVHFQFVQRDQSLTISNTSYLRGFTTFWSLWYP